MEKQRKGRNKETTVNHTVINGGKFRRKFDEISENKELGRVLYGLAKEMLMHRSGTRFEDMYWIDLDTLKIIAQETSSLIEKRIVYSAATEKALKQYTNLLTIHNHPDSFPPSIDDLNSNYEHSYVAGIVVCHDGRVYLYSANERINEKYYALVVEGFIKNGYNEDEAQIMTLSEIKKNFDVDFKEVAGYDDV